jgi:hypothetical protein
MADELPLPVRLPKEPTLKFCAECGEPFYPTRYDQIHCKTKSPDCNKQKTKRRVCGGLKLYDAAMKWRLGGTHKKGTMADFTAIADQLACEERLIRNKRDARIAEAKKLLQAAGRAYS